MCEARKACICILNNKIVCGENSDFCEVINQIGSDIDTVIYNTVDECPFTHNLNKNINAFIPKKVMLKLLLMNLEWNWMENGIKNYELKKYASTSENILLTAAVLLACAQKFT